MNGGSLTVVGSGILVVAQVTREARLAIEQADKVLYAADPVTARWLHRLHPDAESLDWLADTGQARIVTYRKSVERILAEVRLGRHVCAVYYGHPGVLVYATHEAIRQARREGYPARMLAGISAEDCLFADLGLDPGRCGRQGFEATDFLVRNRIFDPTVPLVLWQVGSIGELGYEPAANLAGLAVLVETLAPVYGADHRVCLYLAAQFPVCRPEITRVPLGRIAEAPINPYSTLYVPPRGRAAPDLDLARRLGIGPECLL